MRLNSLVKESGGARSWTKVIFAAGFFFFLVKGLIWVGIGLSVVLLSL
jgi:hypothetical protein